MQEQELRFNIQRVCYLVSDSVRMVWDDKHSDQLQNHDHVVSLLV